MSTYNFGVGLEHISKGSDVARDDERIISLGEDNMICRFG